MAAHISAAVFKKAGATLASELHWNAREHEASGRLHRRLCSVVRPPPRWHFTQLTNAHLLWATACLLTLYNFALSEFPFIWQLKKNSTFNYIFNYYYYEKNNNVDQGVSLIKVWLLLTTLSWLWSLQPVSLNTAATGYKGPLSFQLPPICFNQSHAAAFPQKIRQSRRSRPLELRSCQDLQRLIWNHLRVSVLHKQQQDKTGVCPLSI